MIYPEALIEKAETNDRYTASKEILGLVGPMLSDFVYIRAIEYDEPTTDGILSVNIAYNENKKDKAFLYLVVDWDDAKWASVKLKHSRENRTLDVAKKTSDLEEGGLVELSSYDKMKKSQEQCIEAMVNHGGRVGRALRATGVSMAQHLRWVKTDKEYREAMEVIQEVVVDKAEDLLLDAIEEGSENSAQFLLKNRGASRGYGDQRRTNELEEGKEENALPIEALTIAEQKTLERLVSKMEDYKRKQIEVKV